MVYRNLLGTNTVGASSTTGSVTFGSAVPVGRLVVLQVAWSNDVSSIPTINSVADSRGNTYTVDASAGTGNATVSCAVISAPVTTAIQASDTVTVTIAVARIRWCLQADEFGSVGALDKTAANDAPANSTSMSTGTTAATTSEHELAVACYGFGRGGGATSTLDAGWSGSTYVTTAVGSTDRALQAGYKELSATGTQQGTATLSVSAGYTGCIATYVLATAGPPVLPTSRRMSLLAR